MVSSCSLSHEYQLYVVISEVQIIVVAIAGVKVLSFVLLKHPVVVFSLFERRARFVLTNFPDV